MKFSIKPALITACISCALVIPQLATAASNGEHKRQNPFSNLSLSEEQKSAIKEIGPLRMGKKSRQGGLNAIAPVVLSQELDSVQLDLLVNADIAQHKAKGLIEAEHKFAIQQILSEEQLTQLKATRSEKHQSKADKDKKSLEEKLTKKLSLSTEQLAQMQVHFDALTDLRNTSKSARESFKSFEASLLQQDSFDASLWLAQFELISTSMKTSKVAFATHMHDIYVLLDSEQQNKFRHQIMKPRGKNKEKRDA